MAFISGYFDDRAPRRSALLPRVNGTLAGGIVAGLAGAVVALKLAAVGTGWMMASASLAGAPDRATPLLYGQASQFAMPLAPAAAPARWTLQPEPDFDDPTVAMRSTPAETLRAPQTPMAGKASATPMGRPAPAAPVVVLPPPPPVPPAAQAVAAEIATPPLPIPLPPTLPPERAGNLRRHIATPTPAVTEAGRAARTTPDEQQTLPRALPEPPPQSRPQAMVTPPPVKLPGALPGAGSRTAIYDIRAKTVYLPSGERLEAHSGLGEMLDDPRYVSAKNRGPTPPNTYRLTMRESLFHGVAAIRLTPVGEGRMYGRDGILAHSYMLGPRGDSNGCVSFRDYARFLRAFQRGEITQMVVVTHMPGTGAPSFLASLFGGGEPRQPESDR